MSGGPQPSELAAPAGTERVAEGAWQVDSEELTGRSTVTMRARARVDQDQVRQLPTGEADLILCGLAERVRIIKTNIPAVCTDCGQGPNRPSRSRDPAPARSGTGGRPPGVRSAASASSSAPAKQRAGCFWGLTRRRRPRSGGTAARVGR